MTDLERTLDQRVQRRLQTDPRYRHAENAEQQAAAEEAITRETERDLVRRGRDGLLRVDGTGPIITRLRDV